MSFIRGKVVAGKGIGSKYGFPTVNLELQKEPDIDHGVYAGLATENQYQVLVHYGPRPTIDDSVPTFEVYFLHYPEGSYFSQLDIEILGKLRDIRKFDSMEEMAEQIKKDLEKAVVEYFGQV